MSVEFCDTNILIYSYDLGQPAKRVIARALIDRLWGTGEGAVSIQVLQELYVNLLRKTTPPLTREVARTIVTDFTDWRVVEPEASDVLEAIDRSARWQTSFWDAMMLTTALKAGATVVWTEDLQHGQRSEGLQVRNPFSAT